MVLQEDEAADTDFEGTTIQAVFEVLHNSQDCAQQYHERRGSANVGVTAWQGQRRVVSFSLSVASASSVVKNLIGNSLTVREHQTLTWLDGNGGELPVHDLGCNDGENDVAFEPPAEAQGFRIVAVPVLDVSGSERFETTITFTYKQDGERVLLSADLSCTAKIWGLSSTLEPMMMMEARQHLSAYVAFLNSFFGTHRHAPSTPAWSLHDRVDHWQRTSDDLRSEAAGVSVPVEPHVNRALSGLRSSFTAAASGTPPTAAVSEVDTSHSLPDDAYFDATEPRKAAAAAAEDVPAVKNLAHENRRLHQDNMRLKVDALDSRIAQLTAVLDKLQRCVDAGIMADSAVMKALLDERACSRWTGLFSGSFLFVAGVAVGASLMFAFSSQRQLRYYYV